jgi:hypothetical protein
VEPVFAGQAAGQRRDSQDTLICEGLTIAASGRISKCSSLVYPNRGGLTPVTLADAGRGQCPFIFDAWGSMKKEIDGKRRIDVAKEAVAKTVLSMPQTARTGLMVFGAQRAKDCSDVALVSPIASQTPGELVPTIMGLEAKGETPIADSIMQGVKVLERFPGANNSIVLLIDDIEECQSEPCGVAASIRDKGIGLKVNIVGFTHDSEQRITLKLIKTEREFRASLDFEGQKDDKGEPIWIRARCRFVTAAAEAADADDGTDLRRRRRVVPSSSTRSPSTYRESEEVETIGTFARRLALRKDFKHLIEMDHGTQDVEERFQGCEESDAQAQARHAQERAQRQDREEPEAGDRNRPVGSAPQRQEGRSEEGLAQAEQEIARKSIS